MVPDGPRARTVDACPHVESLAHERLDSCTSIGPSVRMVDPVGGYGRVSPPAPTSFLSQPWARQQLPSGIDSPQTAQAYSNRPLAATLGVPQLRCDLLRQRMQYEQMFS